MMFRPQTVTLSEWCTPELFSENKSLTMSSICDLNDLERASLKSAAERQSSIPVGILATDSYDNDHRKLERSLSVPVGSSLYDDDMAKMIDLNRYKTELCRSFSENGDCKYGQKCQFAHGPEELRPLRRHPKYKTQLCSTYHTQGLCPYGPRCTFIHEGNKKENAKSQAMDAKFRPKALSIDIGSPSQSSCASLGSPTSSVFANKYGMEESLSPQSPIGYQKKSFSSMKFDEGDLSSSSNQGSPLHSFNFFKEPLPSYAIQRPANSSPLTPSYIKSDSELFDIQPSSSCMGDYKVTSLAEMLQNAQLTDNPVRGLSHAAVKQRCIDSEPMFHQNGISRYQNGNSMNLALLNPSSQTDTFHHSSYPHSLHQIYRQDQHFPEEPKRNCLF